MLTPQLITEAAAIYEKLKKIDGTLGDLSSFGDRFHISCVSNRTGLIAQFDGDPSKQEERSLCEDIRSLLIERTVSRRRILERRLAQIGAPVILWPATPPKA